MRVLLGSNRAGLPEFAGVGDMGVETPQYATTNEPGPQTSGRLPKAANGPVNG